MLLKSLEGCKLAIGSYPIFNYNAINGGGIGTTFPPEQDGLQNIRFDPKEFSIPPLNSTTTKILKLPLPPGLEIEIFPDLLEGSLIGDSGLLSLQFKARFRLKIFHWIKAPDLLITTCLTTEGVKTAYHNKVEGQRVQANGFCRLVGISSVPKSGNLILDTFLGLPNEALAILCCEITKH